jgi:hypothetical protein
MSSKKLDYFGIIWIKIISFRYLLLQLHWSHIECKWTLFETNSQVKNAPISLAIMVTIRPIRKKS